MNTKLTLSIEEQVIQGAKEYAKNQGRSLSNIVEEYLKSISTKRAAEQPHRFNQIIEELCGSVKLPANKDYKEIIGDAILDKYLNR